jgi:hypothetical protein
MLIYIHKLLKENTTYYNITSKMATEMKKPEPFYIDSSKINLYYNNTDLINYDKNFYYGCTTKPKTIVIKKKIPESEYLYANLKKGDWNLSSSECKKSQLLISKEWVDKYYFKIDDRKEPTIIPKPVNILFEETIELEESNVTILEEDPINIVEEVTTNEEILEAPKILLLDDSEKFKDADGNIIEIETRGERKEDNIYFKCKDISVGFGMPNLNNNIVDKEKGYTRNVDYKNFNRNIRLPNGESKSTNKNFKTTLYLTYEGLLRVLFVSRNKNASLFRKWATHKLFTIQMGKEEEKVKLGTSILNIPEKTYRAVFNKHADKLPSIYLIYLGNVKELRKTFEIDNSFLDDSGVYKYGFTDDLGRRVGEHEDKYGKLENVKIVLTTFHGIDPKYLRDAENDIKEECNAYEINLQTEGYKELIVLNKKQLEHVKKNYGRIGRDYAGHSAELQEQIVKLKNDLKDRDHTIELLKKDNEKLQTRVETNEKYHKLELENKDLKIETLELKIHVLNKSL